VRRKFGLLIDDKWQVEEKTLIITNAFLFDTTYKAGLFVNKQLVLPPGGSIGPKLFCNFLVTNYKIISATIECRGEKMREELESL
jgi:hypothetical protein